MTRGRAFGIRGKLFFASVALIVIAMFSADAYLSRALDADLTTRIRNDLLHKLDLIAHAAASLRAAPDDHAAWDGLADELGRRARARVTLIASDGRVLGDSEVALAALSEVENHGGRPEVREALTRGRGSDVRTSATIGRRLLYAAVPFHGTQGGIARAALPLADVDAALTRLRRTIAIGTGLALLVAVLMSTVAAQLMSGSLRALTAKARRMAGGDLTFRPSVTGHDELAELDGSLGELASALSSTLGQLRSERDRLDRILENMEEGVLLLDGDGRTLLINGALRKVLAIEGDPHGRTLLEIVRHAELHELLDRASTASVQGATLGEIETAGPTPRRLLVRAAPLRGAPPGTLAVFVDVTHLRKLETQRRDFVTNASHELRTPVAAVRSAAETLRTAAKADPAAAGRFIEIIERNAERLQSLISDLLDLSRIESQTARPELQAVPVAAVAERVLGLFRERAAARKVKLECQIDAGLQVQAQTQALEQVLTNLVDNAVKYAGEGTEVHLSAEALEKRVSVRVRDDGAGIEAQHLPRLFERFYRVDSGRARDQGGTGLGLAIVKHLVESMNGTITVESAPRRGTTFTVSLTRA